MQNQYIRGEFYFLAGHPALDFVNTRPVLKGQAQELLTDFSAVLRWLVAAHLVKKIQASQLALRWRNTSEADAALTRILLFRERLRSAIAAIESTRRIPEQAMEEVNALLKEHPFSFRLVLEGKTVVKKIEFFPATPQDLIGIIASSTADLFSGIDPTRIRKCEACVIHFWDETKNATRRWCSMQFCGNRAKVAAYAARKRRRGGTR